MYNYAKKCIFAGSLCVHAYVHTRATESLLTAH